MSTMNIAIVGAGPLGSATARHLAENGHDVTVFGPDEPVGFEDHRGTWSGHYDQGRLAVTDPLRVATVLGHRAMARYGDLETRSDIKFTTPHPQLMMFPDGSSSAAELSHSEKHVYRMLDAVLENSRDHVVPEVLDGDQLRARFPDMRFADNLIGALQPDAIIVNPRLMVQAELALAEKAGARRVREIVTTLESGAAGATVATAGGVSATYDQVVVATGSGTNASGLLGRKLDTEVYGTTIVLLEVDGPDVVDMPAWMYLDAHFGGGLITPPSLYPDGRWYLKCASGQLLANPLRSASEIADWVSTGGEASELDYFREFVGRSLPEVVIRGGRTWPCLPSINATSVPYIDRVDERTTVVLEGERGVMMADEIGRLGADLAVTGEWRDSLDHAEVAARWLD